MYYLVFSHLVGVLVWWAFVGSLDIENRFLKAWARISACFFGIFVLPVILVMGIILFITILWIEFRFIFDDFIDTIKDAFGLNKHNNELASRRGEE